MGGGENELDDVRIGEIVWARVSGHPWWPATISRNLQKKTWKKQGKVWVNFFNDNQGAWIPLKSHLRPFDDKSTESCMVKTTHRSFKMIKEAVTEASEVLAKQRADGMEVSVVDPDEILAIAERRGKETEEKKAASVSKGRGKRVSSVTPDNDAKRRKINDEIVPAVEDNNDQIEGRTRRRSRQLPRVSSMGNSARKRVVADDRTDTSEEMDNDPPAASDDSKKIPVKITKKMETLEAEATKLKAELRRLKDELKERKALPKKEIVHVAAVPPVVAALEFEFSEEKGTEKCEKEALQELLKTLKQHSHTFEEQSDLVADHRKAAGEMASKFNARVRALSNAETSARKAEIEVSKCLTQLLRWELPFELLKESQAGKPIRKVEMKCGKRSDVIASLSKVLINHWMTIVKTGNESKKSEEEARNNSAPQDVADMEAKDQPGTDKSDEGVGEKSEGKEVDAMAEESKNEEVMTKEYKDEEVITTESKDKGVMAEEARAEDSPKDGQAATTKIERVDKEKAEAYDKGTVGAEDRADAEGGERAEAVGNDEGKAAADDRTNGAVEEMPVVVEDKPADANSNNADKADVIHKPEDKTDAVIQPAPVSVTATIS